MESRIRYKKSNKDNILVSVRDLISESGAKYKVKLDVENCKYVIINVNSERYYHGGEDVNNLHVLKRNVKAHLEKFGVSFSKEIRDNSKREPGVNCSYKKSEEKNADN